MLNATEVLKKEHKRLSKENERLSLQIDTCKDMIHNYNLKLTENEQQMIAIKEILEKIKSPL